MSPYRGTSGQCSARTRRQKGSISTCHLHSHPARSSPRSSPPIPAKREPKVGRSVCSGCPSLRDRRLSFWAFDIQGVCAVSASWIAENDSGCSRPGGKVASEQFWHFLATAEPRKLLTDRPPLTARYITLF